MNISGYEDNNFHDGNTQILGDLIIDGKLTLGGATGQSQNILTVAITRALYLEFPHIGCRWD
jgi:hypothetical protein